MAISFPFWHLVPLQAAFDLLAPLLMPHDLVEIFDMIMMFVISSTNNFSWHINMSIQEHINMSIQEHVDKTQKDLDLDRVW
jgi:hypothetical protein